MSVTPGRVSQIERGELATIDAVARYVEALGGRLDLIASFGDHTAPSPAPRRHDQICSRSQAPGPRAVGRLRMSFTRRRTDLAAFQPLLSGSAVPDQAANDHDSME